MHPSIRVYDSIAFALRSLVVYTLHQVIAANGKDSEAEAAEGGRSGVGAEAASSREQKK